jgi:hypothetical protein
VAGSGIGAPALLELCGRTVEAGQGRFAVWRLHADEELARSNEQPDGLFLTRLCPHAYIAGSSDIVRRYSSRRR